MSRGGPSYAQADVIKAFAHLSVQDMNPPGHISLKGLKRSLKLYRPDDVEAIDVDDLVDEVVQSTGLTGEVINYISLVRRIGND
jgi:hypothetical protein